ncbi:hypothetical protein [Natranaerofaba carboxydovora]|uniref:hypothetical protein n=1 Tax=Natranaerofaba carboxydovora TaxID=2742683 RepID=UPI001F145569|nr:hypothetical protein [Natranaerofaba carboxydovora]UMZ72907.1 hypothetical protein ACONDI_00445 [Natranaerofaba carboxydovora]
MNNEDKDDKKTNLIIDKIRENTRNNRLTYVKNFLEEPFNLNENEILEKIDKAREKEENQDIKVLKGKKGYYFYSNKRMTKEYALILAGLEDNDNPGLIAHHVRNDCKTYPRPTDNRVFMNFPFFLSEEELTETLEEMTKHPDYEDIKKLYTSNGVMFLYSDKHLSEKRAKRIAEHREVISKQSI